MDLYRMNGKYQETIHIDNESFLITHPDGTTYENIKLENVRDWSGSILQILKNR